MPSARRGGFGIVNRARQVELDLEGGAHAEVVGWRPFHWRDDATVGGKIGHALDAGPDAICTAEGDHTRGPRVGR
ncbi:MAG: hypothetical protein HYX32_15555 [Actinobacteria bacterium]|nr:hypothetical protein [Actinomycetota bacterium]